MTVSEAKRLKALEDDNGKLKKPLAEQMLNIAATKALLSRSDDLRGETRACHAYEGLVRAVEAVRVQDYRGIPSVTNQGGRMTRLCATLPTNGAALSIGGCS